MRKLCLLALAAGLSSVAVLPAAAQVVSLNFTGGDNYELAPTDQAGNPDVFGAFVANWNNLAGPNGTQSNLLTAAGVASSVAVEWNTALGVWNNPDTTLGANLAGGANPTMMRGYLDADANGATVKITGLSSLFTSYKVLIYFDGDNGGDWRVGEYTITDTLSAAELFKDGGEDSENVTFNSGSGQNADGVFQIPVPGPNGNAPWPVSPNNDEGNFLISPDLTADSITITAVGTAAGTATLRAPINGIQIIGVVPEPGTVSLLILGGAAALLRRRRR